VARARTGTLIAPDKDGLWKARVTKTHEDGRVSRPVYSLGTTDKAIARRKLAQLVAALAKARGGSPADDAPVVTETVRVYADEWLERPRRKGSWRWPACPISFSRSSRAPGRIRTCDLRLRRPSLYPAELRARVSGSHVLADSVADPSPNRARARWGPEIGANCD
jgi:hypothetical protein